MIRGVPVIAFDGTHSSGKTTLKYAVAAKLKEMGINCSVLSEPARNSPLVDDVVLRNIGEFDLPLEIDLISNHISQCIRATRNCDIILSDRTPINVIAYTRLLVKLKDEEEALFDAASSFVRVWTNLIDAVFYCCDYFLISDNDRMRSKVDKIQVDVDIQTKKEYMDANVPLDIIPLGLSNDKRVDFVIKLMREKHCLI